VCKLCTAASGACGSGTALSGTPGCCTTASPLTLHPTAQAFKSYDEAGVGRRVACLKYVVLANMLMESKVDPFDAQEARPYKQDAEITAMTALVDAYQRSDINEFEKILRTHK
jgi:hypothetical protein